MAFIGRRSQLTRLHDLLNRVQDATPDRPGRAVLVRGRRRVGKSRLIEEFVVREDVPHVYFTASGRPTAEELRLFAAEVAASDLPRADLFRDVQLGSWDAALRLLAQVVPDAGCVVVLDELPYLIAQDPGLEGTLQAVFDRELSRRRILLIGVGSDLAMMEALDSYGRPFHQRAAEMVVPPLSPAEVGDMLGLAAADAFDAYLVTGGLPLICDEWSAGQGLWDYLGDALLEPTSAVLVSAERALAAEFPTEVQARNVLRAIGSGERTFTAIGRAAGGIPQASLGRSLSTLVQKRVVAADHPLSTRSGTKDTRYRVADSYIRFWLAFLGPHMAEIERGRGDRTLSRIQASWSAWRGRAVEPVLREAVVRIGEDLAPGTGAVGSYWTRTNDPEVDLVLADRAPVAGALLAIGSIKWLEHAPFDRRDLSRLLVHRSQVPGATESTSLIAVSRSGYSVDGVLALGPEELIAAWS